MSSDIQAAKERLTAWAAKFGQAVRCPIGTGPDPHDVRTIVAALAEARRQIAGYQHHLRECEQVAGKALGYPWFKDDQKNFPGMTEVDGVCIGDHVGDTIVAELAEAFAKRGAQIAERDEALRHIRARTFSSDRGCELKAGSVAEICDIASAALLSPPSEQPATQEEGGAS